MESTKLIFAILNLVICLPTAAALIELPAEMPLNAPSLTLSLWNADVDIQIDPSAIPTIRAMPINVDKTVQADLEISVNNRNCRIHRPVEEQGEAPRIRFEITVGARQQVTLEGHDLTVTGADKRPPEDEEDEGDDYEDEDEDEEDDYEDEDEEDEGDDYEDENEEDEGDDYKDEGEFSGSSKIDFSSLRLLLEDSAATLGGIRDIVIEARRTTLWLNRTLSSLNLKLEYGSAEIRGHQGHLQLEATESEVTVHELRGNLEPQIQGGSLDVREGIGLFNGTFTESLLILSGWQGHTQVRGTSTTVQARGATRPVPWTFEGVNLLVTLDEISALVTAQLDGGAFEASGMSNPLTVDATNRTEVELETLARGAKLKISNGSTVRLTDTSGQIQAELHDAGLWALRVAQLFLTGERSQVEASEVNRLLGLEMTDSDIVLDLTSSTNSPSLKLMGSGRTLVRLSAPCTVHLARSGTDGSTPNISGCDLRLQGQPGKPLERPSIQGARRPVTITVTLGEGVELDVEGLP